MGRHVLLVVFVTGAICLVLHCWSFSFLHRVQAIWTEVRQSALTGEMGEEGEHEKGAHLRIPRSASECDSNAHAVEGVDLQVENCHR